MNMLKPDNPPDLKCWLMYYVKLSFYLYKKNSVKKVVNYFK